MTASSKIVQKRLCNLIQTSSNLANTGKYVHKLGLPKMPRGTLLDTVGNLGSEKAMKYFEYVDAIHTSAPFGKTERRGHIDFYPNGGSNQPCTCDNPCPDTDCNSSWQQKNDHKRAPAYFEVCIVHIFFKPGHILSRSS